LAPTETAAPEATERAQEVADELGVDLSSVKPTGAEGQITVSDVRNAAPEPEEKSSKGWATKGYTGKQPWESENHGAELHHTGKPTLSSGSGGVPVAELASLLHELGYETSVSRGENSFSILDGSIMAAVDQFRSEYGVEEDPSGFRSRAEAATHVGPWTWEALLRATGRV
jgi:hypothetical protein